LTVSNLQDTYTYDVFGAVRSDIGTNGTEFTFTGEQNPSAGSGQANGRGMIYWVDGSGNATYRLTDGLGSTVALCNSSGTVTDSWTYDVFGAVKTHSGSNATEFTFTGEQNPSAGSGQANGLEYLRARYYDSTTGRFLGRDPLGGGYPYGGNNPANMVDPTGLYTMCVDDPVWGYICYDSTQVGLGACSSSEDCHLYVGDGSAPGNNLTLVERYGNACVFQYGYGGVVPCHHDQPTDPADASLALREADHLQRLNKPDPQIQAQAQRCDELKAALGFAGVISTALAYAIVAEDISARAEQGYMPTTGDYLGTAFLIAWLGVSGYIVLGSGCI